MVSAGVILLSIVATLRSTIKILWSDGSQPAISQKASGGYKCIINLISDYLSRQRLTNSLVCWPWTLLRTKLTVGKLTREVKSQHNSRR